MIRNFTVRSEIELESNGARFDLHNDYDFVSLNIGVESGGLIATWKSRRQTQFVSLRFEHVSVLMLQGLDPDVPRSEDATLAFVGYLHPDDVQIMDGFLPEKMATPQHHIILKFHGGLTVRLLAERAELATS